MNSSDQEPDKLQLARKEYNELTGKKPGPTWDLPTLQERIFEFKTGEGSDKSIPKFSLSNQARVKGNMTGNLPDDHPQKNYEFDNAFISKGSRGQMPLYLSNYYHLWIIPAVMVGKNKFPYPEQQPFKTVLSPQEWQSHKDYYESATNMITTLLHDPKKGGVNGI